MATKRSQEENLKRHFHSPDENLVTILGRGYVQSFITGFGLTKGLLLLTDRRLYQKGKRYIRTSNGGWSSNMGSAVVDVKDITGTSYLSHNPFGLLWASIILGIIYMAIIFWLGINVLFEGFFFATLILPVALLISYFLQKKKLFLVEYGGGSIALGANWFSQAELDEFQKQISLIKGSFGPTITSSKRDEISQSSDQADPIHVLKSRLVEGEITPDEYRKMKSILEDKGSE